MVERDACTVVTHSFKSTGGWAYKIPDPQRGGAVSSARRPFDIIAAHDGTPYAIEVKLVKGNFTAFSLREDYMPAFQCENLLAYSAALPHAITGVFVYYYNAKPRFHEGFFFDPQLILDLKAKELPSLRKSVILGLRNNGKSHNILTDGNSRRVINIDILHSLRITQIAEIQ